MLKVPKKRGNLIVIEGPDGVGKSTLCHNIVEYFKDSTDEFELFSFPGRKEKTLGSLVYELHHNPEKFNVNKFSPSSNQLLHIAAHIDVIESSIIPALKLGKNIILDRFWWSTWVYGLANGVNRSLLKKMLAVEGSAWKNVKPNAVFFLYRETPLERQINISQWNSLKHEYDVLAEKEITKYPVFKIANEESKEELLDIITKILEEQSSLRKSEREVNIQLKMDFGTENLSFASSSAPTVVVSHIHPAKPTIVFDTYWKFAFERQNIFFKRFNNEPLPWTNDPIILKHKFTNAYRASDRVSQFLIREVIYNEESSDSPSEVFFRTLLFKFFNKIETWQLLKNSLDSITYKEFDFDRYDKILSKAMKQGKAIYSAAYIMPSGGTLGHSAKHKNHLTLLEMMMKDELYKKLSDCSSMRKGFELLRAYPTIGDFLAYQFITDINYSEITDFTETEFVIPGPGALDGIRKCFIDRGGLSESELIRFVADIQENEFQRLGLNFQSLWGRPLQLIDCQNLFCEVDKYSRVKHPEISGITGRSRIKQVYRLTQNNIDYWYPPKWEINQKIKKS